MPRAALWFPGWMTVLALLLTASAAAAAPKGSRWGPTYFPNYEVTAHTGETFRFYDDLIENKIVVVNFIYTRCNDICPLQTARLKQVTDRLGDRIGRDIFILTISLEPEFDTAPVLASLADAFETGPGWLFLTGDPKELAEIRYKLGERSRTLIEHRHEMLWVGNDNTGRWQRGSLNADLDRIVLDIRRADPAFRSKNQRVGRDYGVAQAIDISNQRGRALFVKGCAACHSVGEGDRLGPDLAGVAERRDPRWLVNFIRAPDRMRAVKDPVALALDAAYPGVKMPRLGLAETDVADVLAYIAAQTAEREATAEQAGEAPRADAAAAPDQAR